MPLGMIEISQLYLDIKRGADGVGYREIQAYQDVTGHKLSAFVRDIILELDTLRRKHYG